MSEAIVASQAPGTDTASAPGASGARQFWRRLRAQRAALVAAGVVALLVLVALAAPLFTAIEGQDPTTYHPGLVDSARGGVPVGSLGGISGDHWLGVEPQTGRDLFARLLYGARVSWESRSRPRWCRSSSGSWSVSRPAWAIDGLINC